MGVGLRTYDRQGNLVVGVDTRFVKFLGHFDVDKNMQGQRQFMAEVPEGTTAIYTAVPQEINTLYTTPLIIERLSYGNGIRYYYGDDAHFVALNLDGRDANHVMQRTNYRVYYGYI